MGALYSESLVRWVIGDIHGMYRMLQGLLEAVRKRDPAAKFSFVGDYVNRGPESKQVVDLLISLEGAKFVRGNHDEIFDLVVNGQCFEPRPDLWGPIEAFLRFLQFGLDATLTSYGIDLAMIESVGNHPSPQGLAKLLEPIPAAHRAFFRNLPAVIEEPDLVVAHAKWDVDEPNEPADFAKLDNSPEIRHQIIWGRFGEAEIYRKKRWSRPIVFGHTPVGTYGRKKPWPDPHVPLGGPSIVLLDTAAALSAQGRLTAYCVEEQAYVQIDRGGDVMDGAIGK
jgi:serine/threonine protein phosphatase 1